MERGSKAYYEGIITFIEFVKENRGGHPTHICPCRRFDDRPSLYTQRRQYLVQRNEESSSQYSSANHYVNPTMEMLDDAFSFRENFETGVDDDMMNDDNIDPFGKEAYDKYHRLVAEAQTPTYSEVCNEARYGDDTHSKTPKKVVKYFPLTPRLQRLYPSPHIAKKMRWHNERDIGKGDYLRHPADGDTWQKFNLEFSYFASELQNVRLGLSTDGFNPFGASGLSHNTWPVVVIPYNLPPSTCIRKEFNIFTLLISGPKSLGKCLNIFMRSLIDELKMLWEFGVLTYDRHGGSSFMMKAAVMWTISDFPSLDMLGGLKNKGYKETFSHPYSLDVMHIEKNVFDNIISTILRLDKKTKDGSKARVALPKQGVRKHLWQKFTGSSSRKEKVSQATYTVLPNEKFEILEMIRVEMQNIHMVMPDV
ncbi:hypothetical protein QQ045_009398 [Rhodiola kirilowii]